MFHKVTSSARDRIREKRNELLLVVKRSRQIRKAKLILKTVILSIIEYFPGFDYVIVPPKQPKVCFGSGVIRDCLPTEGPALSSFMRRNIGETREFPGPSDFDTRRTLIKRFPNKRGYSLMASKCARLPKDLATTKIPPLGTYDTEPAKVFKKAHQPFGSNTERNTFNDTICTPGPSTYTIAKYPFQNICLCFGRHRFIYPSVQMVCTPINLAVCEICSETPIGDYYRKDSTDQVCCRPCMKEQMIELKSCKRKNAALKRKIAELGKFTLHRYCGFYHDHAGTNAAVQIIDIKDLKYKIRKEDYLASFGY